ncbi:carbonic anhydrase [Streptomyces winkii]|uniref:carbonic anhydrase n=1 Tax=Streptomyces winkii TaxID=3051178 RepID=UPI0028D66122|nr:carbonic anhydrase [Streptomyces sp. DSM 40971]
MHGAGCPDRRALLTGGLGAATVALVGGSSSPAVASAAGGSPHRSRITPAEAFERLMEGNERWVSGDLQHPDRDPDRRELVAQIQQDPFGAVLSCIDSRVPPELIFDTGLGALYVMRTGGEAVGPVVTGSVEYGPVTGGTPLIVVLGHQRCGAVAAAYKSIRDDQPLPGNLQAIVDALRPAYRVAVREDGPDPVETMARAQVRLTAAGLRSNNDLAPLVAKGALAVVGAYYSLDTGEVSVLSGAPS